MTQLSLFDAPLSSTMTPLTAVPTAMAGAATARRPSSSLATDRSPSSLRRLAELIHEGNGRFQSEGTREVQRLGDLARAVVLRHDLMARRREARRAAAREQPSVAVLRGLPHFQSWCDDVFSDRA